MKKPHQAKFILAWLFLIGLPMAGPPVFAQKKAPAVIVDKAEQMALIEEVPLSGTVSSKQIAQLSTEVSGLVEFMAVDIGDQVQAGDEILRLNSELGAFSLAAAKAATRKAIQELDDAKRRLADAQELAKRHTVSVNELESLAAEVRMDGAEVERLQAEQQHQAAQLRRHKLSAPFAGIISRKLTEQGEWIQPGQAVAELIATNNLCIDFKAPQSVYAKLNQTTEISIKLDALPTQTFDGKIETIIPVSDPTTRTFLIRTTIQDPEVKLAPGMSASASLHLKSGEQGVVVHRDALMRYPDGRITVWIVNDQGENTTVSERQVRTGLSFNSKVAITSGLEPDTAVVVQGNEALRDGQSVTIKGTTNPATN